MFIKWSLVMMESEVNINIKKLKRGPPKNSSSSSTLSVDSDTIEVKDESV